ncbi:MAG: hypothetical protein V2I67_08555 [Thermoanaerobaculales bacterium]|jgi:hypothetical protein|nr:hypothetical protein [Thermoanaerobaculales bacterium]
MMTGASPVLVPREDPVGKILFAVVILVFGLTFFVALMTLLAAVFRGQTERCRIILAETPYRALAVGIVGFGVLGGMGWFFYSRAFIRRLLETEIIPGMFGAMIAMGVLFAIGVLAGAPGTFSAVGDRLEALHGRDLGGMTKTALGTAVSVMSAWFPVIGWCFILPMLKLFAFGAGVLALPGAFKRS